MGAPIPIPICEFSFTLLIHSPYYWDVSAEYGYKIR